MKDDILFLAHRIPYPPDRGDKIRSWHLLKYLAGRARLHLACFADDEADAAHLDALRNALGGRLGETHVEVRTRGRLAALRHALASGRPVSLAAFESPALAGFVERLIASGSIGTLFVFSGQMGQFVPPHFAGCFVMDFADMDSEKFAAYAREAFGPVRWLYEREARHLFAFESDVAGRADASLFVSEAEADLFRSRTGLGAVHAVSNGIDLDFYRPGIAAPVEAPGPLLVFTGQMDYPPNVDAVSWFAKAVLPLVPGARFAAVGRNPAPAIRKLSGERVIVTGGVPDVRPWLAAADIVVAPLRIARGIQNKVLEAMAMGRPVVATPAAFEGIEAEPGRDLIVADGAEAMAREIRRLLAAREEAQGIGAAARRRMDQAYRWDARLAPLDALLATAARAAA